MRNDESFFVTYQLRLCKKRYCDAIRKIQNTVIRNTDMIIDAIKKVSCRRIAKCIRCELSSEYSTIQLMPTDIRCISFKWIPGYIVSLRMKRWIKDQ